MGFITSACAKFSELDKLEESDEATLDDLGWGMGGAGFLGTARPCDPVLGKVSDFLPHDSCNGLDITLELGLGMVPCGLAELPVEPPLDGILGILPVRLLSLPVRLCSLPELNVAGRLRLSSRLWSLVGLGLESIGSYGGGVPLLACLALGAGGVVFLTGTMSCSAGRSGLVSGGVGVYGGGGSFKFVPENQK